MAKNKFYVVWKGLNPGIYDNWAECKAQVDGQEGAKYKSFENREEAAKAFEAGYTHYLKTASSPKAVARLAPEAPIGNPINESLAVDAACSGNPGDMEYRGVYTATGQEIFHIGPLKEGTNNVGEFLALVHGLALLQQKGSDLPIYSDSRNAISWVKKKEMQNPISTQTDQRTYLRAHRAGREMVEHPYLYHPDPQMGNIRMGGDPGGFRKEMR